MEFSTLATTLVDGVATVTLNRPDKANAITLPMWREIRDAMRWLDDTAEARVGIVAGAGKVFTAGIDLAELASVGDVVRDRCDGRSREKLRRLVLDLQDTLTAIERCRKPVLAAIHGPCIGGGVDLVCACDIRYCSANAYFAVKYFAAGDDPGSTFDADTGVNHEHTEVRSETGEAKTVDLWTGCYTPRELRLLCRQAGLRCDRISTAAVRAGDCSLPSRKRWGRAIPICSF
jgi:1,4-dihydroxy-2-naphthoyl-CoA synthase